MEIYVILIFRTRSSIFLYRLRYFANKTYQKCIFQKNRTKMDKILNSDVFHLKGKRNLWNLILLHKNIYRRRNLERAKPLFLLYMYFPNVLNWKFGTVPYENYNYIIYGYLWVFSRKFVPTVISKIIWD